MNKELAELKASVATAFSQPDRWAELNGSCSIWEGKILGAHFRAYVRGSGAAKMYVKCEQCDGFGLACCGNEGGYYVPGWNILIDTPRYQGQWVMFSSESIITHIGSFFQEEAEKAFRPFRPSALALVTKWLGFSDLHSKEWLFYRHQQRAAGNEGEAKVRRLLIVE